MRLQSHRPRSRKRSRRVARTEQRAVHGHIQFSAYRRRGAQDAVFAAALFEEFGFDVTPTSDEERFDIIQTVQLRTPEALIAFCQGMQAGAPVDSFVVPEPWDMPGYDSQVIMAAGAFTMGSSIELSADAPLREPYAAWMQGGFNFHSAKAGVMLAAQAMHDRGLI